MPRGDPSVGTFPKPTRRLRKVVADKLLDIDMSDLEVHKMAILSPCGTYRYELRRTWHESSTKLIIIGLNPSTADATNDDPTIRKCVGFAKRWKFGGIIMLNLFAYRAAYPKLLKVMLERRKFDIVGPDNDETILGVTGLPNTKILCAWGTHGVLSGRGAEVLETLRSMSGRARRINHLGLTKGGYPKHPLYLPYTTRLQEWTE